MDDMIGVFGVLVRVTVICLLIKLTRDRTRMNGPGSRNSLFNDGHVSI